MKGRAMNRTKDVWQKVSDMNIKDNVVLGPINAESLLSDQKHLLFTLSRYKFSAQLLKKCNHIIEIGCGEGIGALSFLQETKAKVTAIDFDEQQIAYAQKNLQPRFKRVKYLCRDMIENPYKGPKADGLVCLDVIEHIHKKEEKTFFDNVCGLVKKDGVVVFGTPNDCASQYASERSMVGHINLFDPTRLEVTLGKYFKQVFLFSMNDEMVHTGFNKLAHYLMALCVK